jgi:hypothetical protein
MPGAKVSTPKEPKRTSQKSSNQRRRERLYKPIRDRYLHDNPLCVICFKAGDHKRSEDVHHRVGKVGPLFFDTRYFLAVCRFHHNEVDRDRAWAYREGWLMHGWNHTPKEANG